MIEFLFFLMLFWYSNNVFLSSSSACICFLSSSFCLSWELLSDDLQQHLQRKKLIIKSVWFFDKTYLAKYRISYFSKDAWFSVLFYGKAAGRILFTAAKPQYKCDCDKNSAWIYFDIISFINHQINPKINSEIKYLFFWSMSSVFL